MCEHSTGSMWGEGAVRDPRYDAGLGGRGRKAPAREGVSVPWEEEKGFRVGHGFLDGSGSCTGDQQHAAASPTAHVPAWLSLQVSRYKQVSCAANGKRAKKTIWTREGIWAGLGDLTCVILPLASLKQTPGTRAGNSS